MKFGQHLDATRAEFVFDPRGAYPYCPGCRSAVAPTTSLALWVLVLNGSFVLLMLALAKPLGYA